MRSFSCLQHLYRTAPLLRSRDGAEWKTFTQIEMLLFLFFFLFARFFFPFSGARFVAFALFS